VKILKLLEMQRHAMLMYTSCGWFFDDISGIEPVQIMQYAARAMQLAKEIANVDLEKAYLKILEEAKSNIPEHENGKEIFSSSIGPAIVDFLKVGAHYAISSLFTDYPKESKIYSYIIKSEICEKHTYENSTLVVGKDRIRSEITLEEREINFAIVHFGDHNLKVGVRQHTNDKYFNTIEKDIKKVFLNNQVREVIRLINQYFGNNNYSLWDLFKNEQTKALAQIYENTLDSIDEHFREIYNQYYPLMKIQKDIQIPLPKVLAITVEFVLIRDLCDVLESEKLDVEKLQNVIRDIKRWSFMRYKTDILSAANKKIDTVMLKLLEKPKETGLLIELDQVFNSLKMLALKYDLWTAQEIYFKVARDVYSSMKANAQKGQKNAQEWVMYFDKLSKYLEIEISLG